MNRNVGLFQDRGCSIAWQPSMRYCRIFATLPKMRKGIGDVIGKRDIASFSVTCNLNSH